VTDVADVADVAAVLRAGVVAAFEKALSVGQCSRMRAPAVVIVSQEGPRVVWYGHFRIVHHAQSGSDWGDHVVTVRETTLRPDGTVIAERILGEKTLNVPESMENDYDDDREARDAAGAIMK
jgi:hypothetical protein